MNILDDILISTIVELIDDGISVASIERSNAFSFIFGVGV